jgi:hypothetical protein
VLTLLILIGLVLFALSARAVVNALRELDKTIQQATQATPELGKVAQTLERIDQRIDQRWKAISESLSKISFHSNLASDALRDIHSELSEFEMKQIVAELLRDQQNFLVETRKARDFDEKRTRLLVFDERQKMLQEMVDGIDERQDILTKISDSVWFKAADFRKKMAEKDSAHYAQQVAQNDMKQNDGDNL